uniref:transmembrane protein 241 isoform X7 n=1 Tax=Halichoerus grypus TaxID=9711 RepID=UPI001658D3A7|nr:transmembrane protein 241 isoform X7 [Halichoerus grypus]
MCVRRCLVGLTFCTCYLASYLTNKYVLSVLKFTYPTLFQGWQTLIGGLLLHVSWKLGWAEINSSLRSDVSTWLPASVLFVGIIYAGSRALSKLAIPVFLTLHNVAEVILCGHQKCFRKEKTPPAKTCSALFLLAAAGCLPFNDPQFDPGGYFWAVIHLLCVVWCSWHLRLIPQVISSASRTFHSCISTDSMAAAVPGHHGWLVSIAVRYDPDQCNSGMPPARWTWRGLAGFLRAEGLLRAGRVDSQVPAGVHRPWTSDLPVECVRGKKAGTVRPPLLTASRRTPSAGLWAAAENGLCCVFLLREAPSGPADRAVPRGADPATGVPPVQGRLCSPGLIRRPPC